MSATAPPTPADEQYPRDVSCEIGIHLDNARAITDLIVILCGSRADGSESRIEELDSDTLIGAVYCVRQNVEAAIALQTEHDDHTRKMAIAHAHEDLEKFKAIRAAARELFGAETDDKETNHGSH